MNEFLEVAIEAIDRAEQVHHRGFRSEIEGRNKTQMDLVSEIDLRAEERIIETLTQAYPDHAVLAEEGGAQGESRHRWLVDPLDGTTNYLNGDRHYGVSVALTVDGTPRVGAVGCPGTGDLYTAVAGDGAYRNGRPLTLDGPAELADALLGMGISPPASKDEEYIAAFRSFISDGRTQGVRRNGAGAVDHCLVANGVLDGFFDKYTNPWDVAAGMLIVSEAGGRVTDLEGGPVDLDAGERGVSILASNGEIHDELVDAYATAL